MKKLISLILISGVLLNTGGSFAILHAWQTVHHSRIEQAIRTGLHGDNILMITVQENEDSIIWIKPGKEFRYKGELYDVVKISAYNNHKVFHCLKDSKENKLVNCFRTTQKHHKDSEKRLKRSSGPTFFQPPVLLSGYLSPTFVSFPSYKFRFYSAIIQTPAPPPRQS